MSDYEKWSLVLLALGVFAAVAVVIVALCGERIRQLWASPKLSLRLHEPSLTTVTDGQKAWYYHLRMSNQRRLSPAKNVRVLLTNVLKKAPDQIWRDVRFSGPVQVYWRWHELTPQFAAIGPDKLSTFGHILERADFELQLYVRPNNLKHTIPAGEPTRLVFKAVSDVAESEPLTIEVAWDGEWVDGQKEMAEHLVVKEVVV